jgi:glycosyltransferase involved in cell wall biosynthesis
MTDQQKDLTIVIPVKDEAESIPVLAAEIESALNSSPFNWECIWVDDGSQDKTPVTLQELHQKNHRHRFIRHITNFGQSAALFTGFKYSRGTIIATLDGDLQNDPSDILRLIEIMKSEKVDMVNGVRSNRHDSFVRKSSSKIANGFRNWVTRDSVTDVGCALCGYFIESVPRIYLSGAECIAFFLPW